MVLPKALSLSASYPTSTLGPVGILNTGGFLYKYLDGTAGTPNDAAVFRFPSLDTCNGHPDQACRYHYHKNPENCIAGNDACTLVGYLGDGFPIYSYCTINGTQLRSCYSQTAGTTGYSTSDYTFNTTAQSFGLCHLDRGNGYCFNASRGVLVGSGCFYGYVLSPNYPFVMPAYHGATWYGVRSTTAPAVVATPSHHRRPYTQTLQC